MDVLGLRGERRKKMQQMPWEDDPLKHIKIHGKAWAAGLLALVLICLYPCIFLYSQNAGEAELRDILPFFCIFLASAGGDSRRVRLGIPQYEQSGVYDRAFDAGGDQFYHGV